MTEFWRTIERYPPVLVRLLARTPRGRPLTDQEIASRAGLDPYRVAAIAEATTWDHIPVGIARRFMVGCGLDLNDARQVKRATEYVRAQARASARSRPGWRYLVVDPDWATRWAPMLRRYLASKTNPPPTPAIRP